MMRHRLAAVLALATFVAGPPLLAQPTRAAALFAAYAGGDYNVLARALQSAQACVAIKDDLLSVARVSPLPGQWTPVRAAFLFEAGVTCSKFASTDALSMFRAAREILTLRPEPPRPRPVDALDRLEVAIHIAAIAVLTGKPELAQLYVQDVERRTDALEHLAGGEALVARLRLARGMIAEAQTRPIDAQPTIVVTTGASTRVRLLAGALPREVQALLRGAIEVYERLARAPTVAPEADVRRALVLLRLDDRRRALAAVDRGLAAATDQAVVYWGHLIRGRVLMAMQRLDDAKTAYAHANDLMPAAQTPAIALSAIALMQNDRPAAERWAAGARQERGNEPDPWWIYWYADLRQIDGLLLEIRKALP